MSLHSSILTFFMVVRVHKNSSLSISNLWIVYQHCSKIVTPLKILLFWFTDISFSGGSRKSCVQHVPRWGVASDVCQHQIHLQIPCWIFATTGERIQSFIHFRVLNNLNFPANLFCYFGKFLKKLRTKVNLQFLCLFLARKSKNKCPFFYYIFSWIY